MNRDNLFSLLNNFIQSAFEDEDGIVEFSDVSLNNENQPITQIMEDDDNNNFSLSSQFFYPISIERLMNVAPIDSERRPTRIGLSRTLPRSRIFYSTRYTQDDYELSEIYFVELRNSWKERNNIETNSEFDRNLQVGVDIKNILLDFFYDSDERFPDIDEFLNKVFYERCQCLYSYPQDILKKIFDLYVMTHARIPKCNEINFLIEFFIIHKSLPSDEELTEHIRRSIEFSTSPEDFHQRDKEFVPTIGIDKLPTYQYKKNTDSTQDNDCCAICRDDFQENQTIIQLKPCGHLFHSSNDECLEGASIRNWLEKYNHCPQCRTKIKSD